MRPNTFLKGLAASLLLASTHAAPVPGDSYDIGPDSLATILSTSDNPHEAIETLLNAGIIVKTKPVCDNSGTEVARRDLVKLIDTFCSIRNGMTIEENQTITITSYKPKRGYDANPASTLELTLTTADGIPAVEMDFSACAKNFRRIVDECDTDLENYKQGGTLIAGGIKYYIDAKPI